MHTVCKCFRINVLVAKLINCFNPRIQFLVTTLRIIAQEESISYDSVHAAHKCN